jgi:hypothetical protein
MYREQKHRIGIGIGAQNWCSEKDQRNKTRDRGREQEQRNI